MCELKQKIILIVGASGVGKDSLLRCAKAQLEDDLRYNFVIRYITRVPDANEENRYLNKEEFIEQKNQNRFISTWSSHGYNYAISKEDIKENINIISVSRDAIGEFENAYSDVNVVEIKVDEKLLFDRLKSRARESYDEILKRLARRDKEYLAKKLIIFDNSRNFDKTSKEFLNLIKYLAKNSL